MGANYSVGDSNNCGTVVEDGSRVCAIQVAYPPVEMRLASTSSDTSGLVGRVIWTGWALYFS